MTAGTFGRDDRALGILCAIGSVLLFSSFTLASRLGFSASLRPPDVAALRFGIGGVLMLPVLLRHGLAGARLRDAVGLALFGGLGFAMLAYAGFSMAPAAHGAVLLHGTLPLTTAVILQLSGQAHRPYRPLGLVLVGTGVALMAYDSLAGANLRQLTGDGCLLLASASWSAYGVLARRLALPPGQAAAIVAVFSMVCFIPVYAILPGKALFHVGLRTLVLQGFVQGVLVGAVSIFVYTRAVAALGPDRTALFTAAVPCVTSLAAIPLLSELPSPAAAVGIGAVTLGLLLAAMTPPRSRQVAL